MRVAQVTIMSRQYPAAFTLRVLADLEERTGKPSSEALAEITQFSSVHDTAWLLAELLRAGAIAAGDTRATPSEDELLDGIALDELYGITAGILASIREMEPTLHISPKNAAAM